MPEAVEPNRRGAVLLTGASSGIGQEIAHHLGRSRPIILNGRNLDRLEAVSALCPNSVIWARDLGSPDQISGDLEGFLVGHGMTVESFVHCAGELQVLPLRATSYAQTVSIFNTNIFSAMEILRALLKKKPNRGQLRNVIFISSIASKFGAKGFAQYSASKGALDALMRSLAMELAPSVRVNSILPGGIPTGMTEAILDDSELRERLVRDYPLGLGTPADIAYAVAFLLSDEARWITGQQFIVDGGRSANITA